MRIKNALLIPNGFGDLVMIAPFAREALKNKTLDTIIVKSIKHAELLQSLDVNCNFIYFSRNNYFSMLLLALRLLCNRPTVYCPLLSNKISTHLFVCLLAKTAFVPNQTLHLWNEKSVLPSFDQRGNEHLTNYFESFFLATSLITADFNFLDHYFWDEICKPISSGTQADIAVLLSCGVPERHKIPSPKIFAEITNKLNQKKIRSVLLVGTSNDTPLLRDFVSHLNPSLRVEMLIDASFAQLLEALAGCQMAITGTTGQGHIAGLVVNSLVVFDGVTKDATSGPMAKSKLLCTVNMKCGPCYGEDFLFGCGYKCMEMVPAYVDKTLLETHLNKSIGSIS